MKYYFIKEDYILIRLEKGDKIIESIKRFCEENDVKSGNFEGIGAGEKFDLAVYRKRLKGYKSKRIKGEYEIINLTGDITQKDNKPYIHIHITLADEKMRAFGGHLNEGTITATCEIFLRRIMGKTLKRKFDEEININLIDI